MNIKNAYSGIMTADIESATAWYENLFDRKSDYHPMQTVHEWDFQNGGVLQLVEDKERAGKSSVTLLVDNIEVTCENLKEKQIPHKIQASGDVAKIISIYDPENNRITFAENKQGRK